MAPHILYVHKCDMYHMASFTGFFIVWLILHITYEDPLPVLVWKSVIGERAKRVRHYQGCTNSSWCGIYIYVWRYVCHNSSACHAYVMWAELHHCHFVYAPAVLNVTTGNGTGTINVLKWNRAVEFEFSIQSSVYGATTVAKISLFSTWTRCTVSFYSM